MNTINIKGEKCAKNKANVKLTVIFHKTGFCRAKKVLNITGVYKDWDSGKQQFKPNSSGNEDKNKSLAELRGKYMKTAELWDQEGRTWSPAQWAGCFDIGKKNEHDKLQVKSIFQVIDILIEQFNNKSRVKNGVEISSYSNVREYKFLKSSLCEFTRLKYNRQFQSFHFNHITEDFLNEYVMYLQKRGVRNGNEGGLVHRLKKLRAVVNYAHNVLKNPHAEVDIFKCVESKMKHRKFIPKSVPHSVILQIEDMDKTRLSRLELFHLDLFLFSFYAGGMCNIDVAYLNRDSIKPDNMIEYERIKVCKNAKVPLIDKAKAIIDKYEGQGYNKYVFPIFTHKHISEKQKRERLERLYRKVNMTLEKVRTKIGYEEKITWNSSRGSFITKMINDGYNPSVVAEHAGNSAPIIYKHYYKVMEQAETRQQMNKNF
ncbi:phage integrase SAM-like domain-containing protein [Dysgonomonas sp. GY75]|uniref:tyrosine-type recombinase/integrase n=1 Tax=Dysgonomonas sp. GY75 TaxID=2780419 RepID=UPI001883C9D4|nr:phage integrase SAM-like domain-containing protein [Dysgonomonas sp. GY75]MBF0648571.1 phage integrase SAM-like domain-containing protein [Dysgonomonas sp. GY75]